VGPPGFLHGTYPSGGSERTVVFFGLIAYFLWREFSGRRVTAIWAGAAVAALAFNEGYSRIYLGMHWGTDVLSGWFYGILLLALFIPLIISSGGNSGSQASSIIIRAMALGEIGFRDWWRVMRREVMSGLVLGTILGIVGFLRVAIWQKFNLYSYGEHWLKVAMTVFLSLIGVVMWGTLSGSMLPLILKRLGADPAASSAPFVATLVDVTGLVIYFSIAAIILKGTLL